MTKNKLQKRSKDQCNICEGTGKVKCKCCWQIKQQNKDVSIRCSYCTSEDGIIKCEECNGTGKHIVKKVKRTTG